ncbi:MAG: Holliday junction branch migration protein RuvA [Blastocatellia bacterium]|nr:Holliday junction branch migration protein RuvA [Blastocatellia bacterium]
MIAYLAGKLLEKRPDSVIIETNGVGYEISVPLSTYYELGEAGEAAELRIYTYVREDALSLFGFRTERERDLFLKLLAVQGIGAKSAIGMLSGMSTDELIAAIRSDNIAKLSTIPGVGKKTAERMVIELRDKVGKVAMAAGAGDAFSHGGAVTGESNFDDALSALVNLGYQRVAAEKALQAAVKDGTEISVQKLLRRSLQILAK